MNLVVQKHLETFAADTGQPLGDVYKRYWSDVVFRAETHEAARRALILAKHHKVEARAGVIQQAAEAVADSPDRVDDARDNIERAYRTDPVVHAHVDRHTLIWALAVNDPEFEAIALELATEDPKARAIFESISPLPTLVELGNGATKH